MAPSPRSRSRGPVVPVSADPTCGDALREVLSVLHEPVHLTAEDRARVSR